MPSFNEKIQTGHRDMPSARWVAATWTAADGSTTLVGELALIRTQASSGNHRAGLWRSGGGSAGCAADGGCSFNTSALDGDETFLVLQGTATMTVTATGARHTLRPGSIVSHPKGLAVHWETGPGPFRSFWVRWDSEHAATAESTLFVGHVDDDPLGWEPYEWVEPENGFTYCCGEMLMLRRSGSTGTLRCGIWRSAPVGDEPTGALAACADGRCAGHRIGSARGVGDETMILLEGSARLPDSRRFAQGSAGVAERVCGTTRMAVGVSGCSPTRGLCDS